MIEIEKVAIDGFEAAIRGMRNPLNSWEKSDSGQNITASGIAWDFCVGNDDLKLMKSLVKAGSDHSKFMRFINVTMDITAPLYWWKEFDTYKVGTVRNSCSTMHKITAKVFTLDDFSHEHLTVDGLSILEYVIEALNDARDAYLEYDTASQTLQTGITKEDVWWQIIQLLPSSYNQRATVQLNYAVLRNMYHSRKNHKLDEWREFCKELQKLPYRDLIISI